MSGRRGDDIDPRAHRVLADVSRVAVLETLRRADRPLAIPEIAAAVGLHPNTVRAHLALLVQHGYATEGREDRERPGRPRLLYRATALHDDRDNYRLLAEILLAHLSERDERSDLAVSAGRAYGRRAVPHHAPAESAGTPGEPPGAADYSAVVDAIVALLDEAGFQPVASPDGSRIELHRCPFRELAQAEPEVVCGVHLGLMQGALAELGVQAEAVRLRPFVRPGLCLATLDPRRVHRTDRRTEPREEAPVPGEEPT